MPPAANADAPGRMLDRGLDRLLEWLRIPSVSTDTSHRSDIDAAANWLVDYVNGAGGRARTVATEHNPIVVGEWLPSDLEAEAPTVLLYGHYDVQPAGELDAWMSPPFEPQIRDRWLYARGAADDKGPFFALLRATEELAAEGRLGVRVRVVGDGEEEVLGNSVVSFLAGESDRPAACLIFDGRMPADGEPVLLTGCRGLVYLRVRLRTGERELHSGFFGGAALNAAQALSDLLAGIADAVPDEGVVPKPVGQLVADDPLASASALAEVGARPRDEGAEREFVARTLTRPALDLHSLTAGEPGRQKTVIPVDATADLSVRLVPDQEPEQVAATLDDLLRRRCPAGAELEVDRLAVVPPARLDCDSAAIRIADQALSAAFGVPVRRLVSGGTIPIVAFLAREQIPTVMSGLDVPSGNAHAPNERLSLEYLERGIDVARTILRELAGLTPTRPRQDD